MPYPYNLIGIGAHRILRGAFFLSIIVGHCMFDRLRGPTGSFNDDCYSSVTMESTIVDGAVSAFPF